MALSEQARQILGVFFAEQASENTGVDWLVDFVLLSQRDQAQALKQWAQAKRSAAVNNQAGLDAERAAAETRLATDITELDSIITEYS